LAVEIAQQDGGVGWGMLMDQIAEKKGTLKSGSFTHVIEVGIEDPEAFSGGFFFEFCEGDDSG
jgi:hypothetical protein